MPDQDATPAAAELAERERIDLAEVNGTGSGGRVVKADIEAMLAAREKRSALLFEGKAAQATCAKRRYLVRLIGPAFPAVDIPMAGTSVVITRAPVVILEAQRDALLAAIEQGRLPGLKKSDFLIEEA